MGKESHKFELVEQRLIETENRMFRHLLYKCKCGATLLRVSQR